MESDAELTELLPKNLPGRNCGRCGYPGCAELAAQMAACEAKPELCAGITPEQAGRLARYIEEAVLVLGCLDCDPNAWKIVQKWVGCLLPLHRRRLCLPPLTGTTGLDDLVQFVLVKLVSENQRLLRSFDPAKSPLSKWLQLAIADVVADHVRACEAESKTLAKAPKVPEAQFFSSWRDSSQCWAELLPVLKKRKIISPCEYKVLWGLLVDGWTPAAVAAELGVKIQTVYSLKNKALEKIFDAWGDLGLEKRIY